MWGVSGWFLLIGGSMIGASDRVPCAIPVPGWVLNWVSLPECDMGCVLVSREKGRDILGPLLDVTTLQRHIPRGSVGVIRILVDVNHFSPVDVLWTLQMMRDNWEPGRKAVIFFQCCQCEDVVK